MTEPQETCDWCGQGNGSDNVKLCARCEEIEERCLGDMGLAYRVRMKELRRKP